MTALDNEIYKILKEMISYQNPSHNDIAKFPRKRKLLEIIQGGDCPRFELIISGKTNMRGGPIGNPEYEPNELDDMDLKIKYTGKWYW